MNFGNNSGNEECDFSAGYLPSEPSFFHSLSNYLNTFPGSPPPPSPSHVGLPSDCIGINIGEMKPTTSTPAQNRQRQNAVSGVKLKGSKKRSRMSGKVPTTVLTTDTSNFRQMVQEFTGIPTSRFATLSSLSQSGRIDPILVTSGLNRSSPPSSPYLSKPFAPRIITPAATKPNPLSFGHLENFNFQPMVADAQNPSILLPMEGGIEDHTTTITDSDAAVELMGCINYGGGGGDLSEVINGTTGGDRAQLASAINHQQ